MGNSSSAPKEISKIKDGLELSLNRDEVANYNYPNYLPDDMLISSMHIKAAPYDPIKKHNLVYAKGVCQFPKKSRFPELQWNHLAASTMDVIISQSGKTIQTVTSECNGAALIKCNARIIKPVPLNDISFTYHCQVFVKMKKVWINSNLEFLYKENTFCRYVLSSAGAVRNYDALAIQREKELAEETV